MSLPGGPPSTDRTKTELRRLFLELRQGLGPAAEELGVRVQQLLLESQAFGRADRLMVYLPFRGEVPTQRIIERALAEGKTVTAPATLKDERRLLPLRLTGRLDELRRGAYGILEPEPSVCEPVPPEKLDLVVVPGVVFDLEGGRLGYGGGYYDRFLALEARGALKAALAYEVQVSPDPLPLDAYDTRMDLVITERRIIRGGRRPGPGGAEGAER